MMSQNPKKIQVLNVPKTIPVPRMLDKLTIYFQKPRNGGGEVLDVEYPTSVKDCAYVIFEKEEDANNVLKREQVLVLDGTKYKLEVREVEKGHNNADDEQVMLFVSTKLDTSHFPKGKARQLIFRHDFQVVNSKGCIVEIKGSFSSLKNLRSDLMNLILHRSPQEVTDLRHSANKRRLDKDEKYLQSGAFRNYRQTNVSGSSSDSSTASEGDDYDAGKYALNIQSRSCVSRVYSDKNNSSPLPLVSSPSSLPVTSSSDIEDISPYTHRSALGLQETVGHSSTEKYDSSLNAYSSHSSTSYSSTPHLSFIVDKLVFNYLQAFGTKEFHRLLEAYSNNIEMVSDGELYKIHLYPTGASNCLERLSQIKSAICEHIHKIQLELRVHQVDLTVIKPSEKNEIFLRCSLVNQKLTRVLLINNHKTISLVGPSAESYNVWQHILGESPTPSPTENSGPCQRGRRLNHSGKHAKRNSSCPPTSKEKPLDDSNANLPENKKTQVQTTDQRKILSRKPSSDCAYQKRRSLSESRKTPNKQKPPNDFDIQDSQTKAGRSFEVQTMQDNKQSKFPGARQSLIPNPKITLHKSKKGGKPGIAI
ncbi:uncharacterized protein si:dkey-154b15.1 isoform X2 [Carcharodon carcharias]|nr:uncharacterized protein si:dkey-154b15.1 isoform X2 [Carcharodon carcharias]XP_041044961.1 uncharacterized protein si:dkey-154b15.1 isoform X2 [Carcharodon carcharias]